VRASEWIEVQCLRSLFAVPSPAGSLREVNDAVAVRADGLPGNALNRIVGLYDLSQLDDLAAVYGDRPYWVSLDPEAGADANLIARGFIRDDAWQKFERGVQPVDARTDLEVAEARAPGDFASVVRATWGAPPDSARWLSGLLGHPSWHSFIAYDGEQPVAAGMLYAEGEVGWLGITATLVEHRGRGAQSAILAARVDRARELGLRLLVTETEARDGGEPGPSYRNVLRLGFEPAYVRPNYKRA
jgi:GNAT superfamily N-acetyltransferase